MQEEFKVVGCKKFCDMSRQDIKTWIENVEHADMLRPGNYEGLKKKPKSIGGYLHAHVSRLYFHSKLYCTLINAFRCCSFIIPSMICPRTDSSARRTSVRIAISAAVTAHSPQKIIRIG